MNTFHHGGRIGDLIFALWTMKRLGGGKLIVSDYHQGNWSLELASSMVSFLEMQSYIEEVSVVPYAERGEVDYDLQKAETDRNPEAFPDYRPESGWPGNANILRRYAIHFGLDSEYVEWRKHPTPWLEMDPLKREVDVAFHCPIRRSVRLWQDWILILRALYREGIRVEIMGREPIMGNLNYTLLDSASAIQRAKIFLGTVSSCNAVAEGLGKTRLVEQAPDCFNVHVDPPSLSINLLSNEEIVRLVKGIA